MSDTTYDIKHSTLSEIADSIRSKNKNVDTLKPKDMAKAIRGIQGGEGGVDTSDATAAAGDILSGTTAYTALGWTQGTMPNNGTIEKTIDGINTKSTTIPAGYTSGGSVSLTDDIDNEVDTQADLITQITTALEGKAASSGGIDTSDATATASDILSGKTAYSKGKKITGSIETKTKDDLIVSSATVTVPAGYYASQVAKGVALAYLPTPEITIDDNGLITATSNQTLNGYVTAGTKSKTKQMTTQAAKTITPGTSSQTAVASGVYTTGAVTVAGDSNLKASNIKSGISIFGITGNYEAEDSGSGSGGSVGTCSVTIIVPAGVCCFGYGKYNVYVNTGSTWTSLGTDMSMPSTSSNSHYMPIEAKYEFLAIPVGSVFTFYRSGGAIKGATISGGIEFSLANHTSTTSASYNFAVCKCNGSGTITINV